MKRPCSDKRLARLVRQALYALEDPAAGFVFDDFDRRYCEQERKREADAARWFYRDKTPFETKYEADCGRDGEEPAWVSDGGQGVSTSVGIVSATVDGDETCEDDPRRRNGLTQTRAERRAAALKRVRRRAPHALETLKLIFKNTTNRKESICALVKSQLSSRANGNAH